MSSNSPISTKEQNPIESKVDTETFEEQNISFDSSMISKLMSLDGPTVKAVLLEIDGSMKEINYDSTPRNNEITKILGFPPTIIGEWSDLNVIVVGCRLDELKKNGLKEPEMNQNKLRFPFNNNEFRGKLFLYRLDKNATPKDFYLEEYKIFLSKAHEDIGKKWVESELSEEEEEDEDNEDNENDENDENEDEEEQDFIDMNLLLRNTMENKIRQQFLVKFGRNPTEEEVEQHMIATMSLLENAVENMEEENEEVQEEEEENDEDYNPMEDIQQLQQDEKEDLMDELKEDELMIEQKQIENELNELNAPMVEANEEDILQNEIFQKEYAQALEHVQQLGVHHRQQILRLARLQYQQENGVDVPDDELEDAFKLLSVKLMGMDQIQECEEEEEEEELNNNDNNNNNKYVWNEEVMDDMFELNEEEFKRELNVALENVRNLGKKHREILITRISQTFQEINDRTPSVQELQSIFIKMKQKFAEEARDELFDEQEENLNNDMLSQFATIVAQKDSSPSTLKKAAYLVVLEDLKQSAIESFFSEHNREPNKNELQSMVIELSKKKFSELALNFNLNYVSNKYETNIEWKIPEDEEEDEDEDDEEDEDYIPNEEEIAQMKKDEAEDFEDEDENENENENEIESDNENKNEMQKEEEDEEDDEEYVPNELEIKQMIKDQNEDYSDYEEEEEEEDNNDNEEKDMEDMKNVEVEDKDKDKDNNNKNEKKVHVLTTPVKHKKDGSRVDIYLENKDKNESLKKAEKQFKKIHGRNVDENDQKKLNAFLETGRLLNVAFDAAVEDKEDVQNSNIPLDQ